MDLLKLKATLGLDSSSYKTGLDDALTSANRFGRSMDSTLGKAYKGFTVLKGVMSNVITGGINKAASAITQNLGGAISRIDIMNNYSTTMQGLGYSANEAEQQIKALSDGIDGLPTTLPGIVSMQQQFAALGIGLKKSTDLTLALNNATLAGGQGQEIANSAMQQWYQILASGKSDLESMKIINMAMPAQMDAIAKSVLGANANWQDLHEAWKNNPEITQRVMDAILELNEKGSNGMASFAEQAMSANDSIGTSFTNLSTAITKGIADVVENGIGRDFIVSTLNDLKVKIKDGFSEITNFIKDVKSLGFSEALEKETPRIKEGVNNLLDVAGNAFWTVIKKLPEYVPLLVSTTLEVLSSVIDNVKENIKETLSNVDEFVSNLIEGISKIIVDVSEWIRENMDTIVEIGGEIMYHIATALYDNLPYLIDALMLAIANLVAAAVENLPTLVMLGVRMMMAISRGLIKGIVHIPFAIASAVENIIDKFLGPDWADVGRNIIKGVIKGIIDAVGNLVKTVVNAVKTAYNSAKSYLGIASPSKLFRREIGGNIGQGLALGITDSIPMVTDAMDAMNDSIVEPYDGEIATYEEPSYEDSAMDVLTSNSVSTIGGNISQRDITVVLQLDRTQLARTVFRLNGEESQRVGVSLAGGKA